MEDDARTMLRKAGMSRGVDALAKMALPCVDLTAEQPGDDPGTGEPAFGGAPDAPPGFEWPRGPEGPLPFMGQVNMAAVQGLPGTDVLPSEGVLAFFCDSEALSWEPDADNMRRAAVRHFPATGLERCTPPDDLPAAAQVPCCRVFPRHGMTFPPVESPEVGSLNLDPKDEERYFDIVLQDQALGPGSYLLGHPVQEQGWTPLECRMAVTGLDYESFSDLDEGAQRAHLEAAADWRLLLQLSSAEPTGWMFGDGGYLYFWIHADDLANARFDRVMPMLQTT